MSPQPPCQPEADFLLPPIQFSRCELGVLLGMAQRCATDPGISREDRSNATLFHHMVRTHFESVLCMSKEELFLKWYRSEKAAEIAADKALKPAVAVEKLRALMFGEEDHD